MSEYVDWRNAAESNLMIALDNVREGHYAAAHQRARYAVGNLEKMKQ